MADVITRLKLDSGEYDSKIQRAVSGLKRMEEECRNVGGTLAILEKDQKDYVQSLGQMQTVSNSVRGKISELSNAYLELRSQYNRLTEEEKKGDFGKALSSSLDQLKQRVEESKAELAGINSELNNTGAKSQEAGGMLDQLAQKFTINIDALKLFEIGMKAVNVALDVAKDTFFASEANVDEWGRTVQSAQSVYEGFLTAINNGDISGYLNNIDSIVKAARQAYDELDKLGTLNTIQAPQISRQQTENDRIRMMIQTGRYIAPQDGRRAATVDGREMETGDRLTAAQIRALEKSLQGGMQKMVNLVGNEVEQTGRAIDAYYDNLAKINGMSLQEFKKGTSSWDEFSKRIKGYDDYQKFESEHTSTVERWNPHTMQYETGLVRDEVKNPYQQYANWGTFRVDKEGDNSYKDLVNLIKQRDQQIDQMYNTQGQAYRAMNRAEGFTVRQVLGGGGGGTTPRTTTSRVKGGTEPYTGPIQLEVPEGTTESMKQLSEQLRYFNELRQNATTTGDYLAATEGIEHTKLQMGVQGDALAMGVSTDAMLAMQEGLKESMAESFASVFEGFQINEKDVEGMKEGNPMEEMKKGMEKLSTVMSGLSSITSGLSAVGIKLDGQFGQFLKGVQGVISIVQGVMAIIQAVSTPAEVTNTVATNLNTTALGILTDAVAANSIIHAIPGLANGGVVGHAAGGLIVPGNFPSGDQIPIAVNSGEVILNKAQAGNLLAQMQDADNNGNGNTQPYIDGETIFLGLNNYLRRSGMGEIVTSNI